MKVIVLSLVVLLQCSGANVLEAQEFFLSAEDLAIIKELEFLESLDLLEEDLDLIKDYNDSGDSDEDR
jgi:hypothetical protein